MATESEKSWNSLTAQSGQANTSMPGVLGDAELSGLVIPVWGGGQGGQVRVVTVHVTVVS